jgi:hypothetical protein
MLPGTDMYFFSAQLTNQVSGDIKVVALNIPLPPIADTQRISYMIDIKPINDTPTSSFLCEYISQTSWVKESDFVPNTTVVLIPIQTIYDVPLGTEDSAIFTNGPPFSPPVPPFFPPLFDGHYRGDSVPNIDLDNQNNPPTNALPGDWQACGPAAAGNSLQYLVEKHAELSADTTTLRQKVDSLKRYMSMSNDHGVRFDSFVVGKLRLIDELGLKIRVKYQTAMPSGLGEPLVSTDPRYGHFAENESNYGGLPPDFDYLRGEIDDGEDVEINVGYYYNPLDSLQIGDTLPPNTEVNDTITIYDLDGIPIDTIVQIIRLDTFVRDGGHFMVAAGYIDGDIDRGIWINDDTHQGKKGGIRQVFYRWNEDGANGFPYLEEFDSRVNNSVIYRGEVESVISESYDPDVSFEELTEFEFKYHPVNYLTADIQDYLYDVYFSFIPPDISDFKFLNVGASLTGSSEMIWVIKNAPIPPNMPSSGEYIKFDAGPVTQNQPLPATMRFYLGIGNYLVDFRPSAFIDLPAQPIDHLVFQGSIVGSYPPILNVPVSVLPPFIPPELFPHEFRGCEVPNVDLDASEYPFDPENPASTDEAACGPAAAANSLEWLDQVHDSIDIPGDLRSTLDSLKELMDLNGEVDPLDPNSGGYGVYDHNFIAAKLAFIDRHKLPIHVKFQTIFERDDIASPNPIFEHSATNETSSTNEYPEFGWLSNEIEHGEDVEVIYGYYKHPEDSIQIGEDLPDGHVVEDTIVLFGGDGLPIDTVMLIADTTKRVRVGGHFINLTGYAQIANDRWLCFKDDIDQQNPGGTVSEWTRWILDEEGYGFLESESPGRDRAYVETVVSESYDPTITFCTDKVYFPDDDGDGTLRKAMECTVSFDTIEFAKALKGDTIKLTSSPLNVDHAITLIASVEDSIFIQAKDIARIFVINEAVEVNLVGIHLIGSSIDGPGRAILNSGQLTLENVKIENAKGELSIGTQVENVGGTMKIEGATRIEED